MSESIEHLIKVTNDNLESYLKTLQVEIEKTHEFDYIKNIKKIDKKMDLKIDKLMDLNNDITSSLKTIKRLKLLRNKLKKMKSKRDEISMFAYKPERMDSSDEERFEKEEQRILLSSIRLRPPNEDSIWLGPSNQDLSDSEEK